MHWDFGTILEGSDTILSSIIDKPVWLAEACLISINYLIISLFDLYVESLNMKLKLLWSDFVNMIGNKIWI